MIGWVPWCKISWPLPENTAEDTALRTEEFIKNNIHLFVPFDEAEQFDAQFVNVLQAAKKEGGE